MNSRKKRFWKLWEKRNEELARTDVKKANKIRDSKFLHNLSIKQTEIFLSMFLKMVRKPPIVTELEICPSENTVKKISALNIMKQDGGKMMKITLAKKRKKKKI